MISDEDTYSLATISSWVRRNYRELFEAELEGGWYTDLALWPQERTFELFQAWFEVECYSEVVDMAEGDISEDAF